MDFRFFNPALKVTVTHGDLPHWDQEGATYFITWRMADSIPSNVWKRWQEERQRWLWQHGIQASQPDWLAQFEELPEETRRDFRRFSRMLEQELDACHGSCALRRPEASAIVGEALRHFDGDRYVLGDFVIMPNHVHLLVGGLARQAMVQQVTSWKKWTARKIHEVLGGQGRFWQDESFDHLVRDEASFLKLREYVAGNPLKAGLKPGEYVYWRREG